MTPPRPAPCAHTWVVVDATVARRAGAWSWFVMCSKCLETRLVEAEDG